MNKNININMNEDNHPLISIIVPIYNVEEYLHECIDSILGQTYSNIELILVDDGSNDACSQICDDYCHNDSRVKCVHKSHKGVSSARNIGLLHATGELIGFVDSDDYCDLTMYEQLYNLLISNGADISICGWHYIDNGISTLFDSGEIREMSQEEALDELFGNVCFGNYLWNKLFKRYTFENVVFPEGMVYEDLATSHIIFSRANKVVFHVKPMYYYRKRLCSITNSLRIDSMVSNCKAIDMKMSSKEAIGREHMMDDYKIALCCYIMMFLENNVYYFAERDYLIDKKNKIFNSVSYHCLSKEGKVKYLIVKAFPNNVEKAFNTFKYIKHKLIDT